MDKLTKGKLEYLLKLKLSFIMPALLTTIAIAYYSVFYNRRLGIALLLVFIFAVPLYRIIAEVSAAKLYASVVISQDVVHKGDTVLLSVTIRNGSIFPIPFLHIEFYNPWNIPLTNQESAMHVISVAGKKTVVIEKVFQAQIWGTALLGVKTVSVYDYLGMSRIVYNEPAALKQTAHVCPAIIEPQKNDLLSFICNEMVSDDKEEDLSEKKSFLTQPGYEHRPYIPGDPLKQINWKIFAKTEQYMVRENEFLKSQSPVILLDRYGLRTLNNQDDRESVLLEERMIESVLAMLTSMVKQSLSCKTYYYLNNGWHMLMIESFEQIITLSQIFSKYCFSFFTASDPARIPEKVISDSSSVTIFTCMFDNELLQEVSEAKINGNDIIVVCPETTQKNYENTWVVNQSYDFYIL